MTSLSQGLQLVEAVVSREVTGRAGYTVSRLADEMGFERSRTSRLVNELIALGFLERVEGGILRTGARYFELAATPQLSWVHDGRFVLRKLASAFPANTRLCARIEDAGILMRIESGPHGVNSAAYPGMQIPLWCTGSGRALLWDDDEPRLREFFDSSRTVGVGGPAAAHTADELVERMRIDRETGYIAAREEFEHEVVEYAYPVRIGGRIAGSVSAAVHVRDGSGEIGDAVRAAAAEVERAGGA